ncbi:MAG: RING-HC finger protein [Pedobacter sp.]|nr:MAG: RING-HC finger protein [Pedobacter sp.]
MNEDDMCVVCMDAPSVMHFSPCGHQVTCAQCAENIAAKNSECPMCRCRLQ